MKEAKKCQPEPSGFVKKLRNFTGLYEKEIPRRAEIAFLVEAADYIEQLTAKPKVSEAENKYKAERIKELEAIADLAFDIHTRDPVNVKAKWGVCGARAEELLCDKIDKIKGVKDGPGIPKTN